LVGEPLGSPFADDVVICDDEQVLVEPEKLPDQPLDAISHHRYANFPAYGHTESCLFARTRLPENDEMGSRAFMTGICYAKIFPSFPDPLATGKGRIHITYLQAIWTESFLRPLARRLLITSLPFLVDMRTRKPWVLLREILLG
jgi:hypothetical protein